MAIHCNKMCMDFGGNVPSSVRNPITIHRGIEKDVMPFRHGMIVSTYMNDYIPPLLSPGYGGHIPTIANGAFGNTFGNATKKYFQNTRQEVLTKSSRPKYVFGRLPTTFCPIPEVAYAERAISWKKLEDTPSIRPISYDMKRYCEIQRFYQNAQDHRDYYLDKTEKVYPVDRFNLGVPYPVSCPIDEREFKIRKPHGDCDVPGYMGPMPYFNCRKLPCILAQGFLEPFDLPRLPRPPFVCGRTKPKKKDDYDVLMI